MEPAFFKNTMKDVNAISPILEGVVTQALKLGVNPKGINLVNAWSRCDRTIREHLEAEHEAQELGYSSLPMALKALGQLKNRQDHISYLPEVFHTFPHIWIRGKVDSKPKAKDGFNPMAPSVARRRYKQIVPLLIEAWQLAERREEAEQIHDAIVREYLSVSADKFVIAGVGMFAVVGKVHILPINLLRHCSQINNSVICFDAVDVVNY